MCKITLVPENKLESKGFNYMRYRNTHYYIVLYYYQDIASGEKCLFNMECASGAFKFKKSKSIPFST